MPRPPMAAVRPLLLVLTLTLTACGADRGDTGRPFVPALAGADTLRAAGSAAARFHDVPGLTLTRETVIDGTAENLVDVGWIAITADGNVGFSQSQDGRIRFFDPEGRALGAVGGQGAGPGEFEIMNSAGWLGDSLWVFDGRQSRFTLFYPERTFVRTVASPDILGGPTVGNSEVYAQALLPGERMVGRASNLHEEGTTSFVVLGRDGTRWTLHSEIGRVPAVTTSFSFRSTTGVAYSAIPFAMRRQEVVGPLGDRLAVLGADLEGEHAETFEVVLFGVGGDVIYQRRYPFAGETVPTAVADSAVEAQASSPLADRMPGMAAAIRSDMSIPPFYAPVEDIRMERDGTLWIRLRETAEGRPYLVLDPAGVPEAVAMFPTNARVYAAQDNDVWAVELDEFDVPSVVRYQASGW